MGEPVLQQEPAHVECEGPAQAGHLVFGDADGAMRTRAEEAKDAGQALLLLDGDLSAVAQEADDLTPFCRVV